MTIAVQDLSFSYDKKTPVLEEIEFRIENGQFIGVFGPNGGGKTTLLMLLLGLLNPTKGKLIAQGRIGYVPQVRRFDRQFPISVLEVVLQGCLADYRGWGNFSAEAKKRAFEALEKVGLADKARAPFGTLSGGQIQRTLIARALASNPEILLLDEATVGIDPEALSEIFKFLISLKGELTVLMVTHELQVIGREMDQLFCIDRTLTLYSPEQICQHFALGLYHPKLMQGKKND
ncbi:MAG: ATP-binding cassette domain-containing protein [Verrucomicrobia bacterium]|nr:ATP-binding cassette domain-containing protein [Verrucomicrobiota bacterium]